CIFGHYTIQLIFSRKHLQIEGLYYIIYFNCFFHDLYLLCIFLTYFIILQSLHEGSLFTKLFYISNCDRCMTLGSCSRKPSLIILQEIDTTARRETIGGAIHALK